jgi:hypothetical protein
MEGKIMHRGISFENIIDISIDVQTYINHVRLTKEIGMPFPDKPFFASKYDIEFISEIESYAGRPIEAFQDNWYELVKSIVNNQSITTQQKVFALESIANDASKLIDA